DLRSGSRGRQARQTALPAVACRNILHGLGRTLRHRGHRRLWRLRTGPPLNTRSTVPMEFPYGIDAGGTFVGGAGGGWLLCVGTPGAGAVLGFSGGVALA